MGSYIEDVCIYYSIWWSNLLYWILYNCIYLTKGDKIKTWQSKQLAHLDLNLSILLLLLWTNILSCTYKFLVFARLKQEAGIWIEPEVTKEALTITNLDDRDNHEKTLNNVRMNFFVKVVSTIYQDNFTTTELKINKKIRLRLSAILCGHTLRCNCNYYSVCLHSCVSQYHVCSYPWWVMTTSLAAREADFKLVGLRAGAGCLSLGRK